MNILTTFFALYLSPAMFAAEDVEISGHVGAKYSTDERWGHDSKIALDARISQRIRTLLEAKFSGTDIQAKEALRKASLELLLDEDGAWLLLGKRPVAFGQHLDHSLKIREVLGAGAVLTGETLGQLEELLDSLEVSLFEAGAEDWSISRSKGIATRMGRSLDEHVLLNLSGALIDHHTEEDQEEVRLALGISHVSSDRRLTWWAQGYYLEDHPDDGTRRGISLGMTVKFWPRWKLKGTYRGSFGEADRELGVKLGYSPSKNWEVEGAVFLEEGGGTTYGLKFKRLFKY